MAAPTITEAPDAPVRGDDRETFASKANDFVSWQAASVDEYNALAAYVEQTANALALGAVSRVDISSSRNAAESDLNNILDVTASCTYTLTTDLGSNGNMVIAETDTGATLTIGLSGVTLEWLQGGAIATGSVTVAPGSAVVLSRRSSSVWRIYGKGISEV